jgi:hypothetical protein
MVLVFALGIVAAGCAGGGAAERAAVPSAPQPPPPPLPLLTKNEAPPYCQFRGAVTSRYATDEAYWDLQHKGAALGATHVVLDGTRAAGVTWGYRIRNEMFGRAYWCPPPPSYAPAPPPGYYASPGAPPPYAPPPAPAPSYQPAAETCAPACQAGYACVGQACVPVCDPPCAAGRVCATDRVCRAR